MCLYICVFLCCPKKRRRSKWYVELAAFDHSTVYLGTHWTSVFQQQRISYPKTVRMFSACTVHARALVNFIDFSLRVSKQRSYEGLIPHSGSATKCLTRFVFTELILNVSSPEGVKRNQNSITEAPGSDIVVGDWMSWPSFFVVLLNTSRQISEDSALSQATITSFTHHVRVRHDVIWLAWNIVK
jgi:hypothetical protein